MDWDIRSNLIGFLKLKNNFSLQESIHSKDHLFNKGTDIPIHSVQLIKDT